MIEHTTVPLGRWRGACEEALAEGFTVFDLLTAVDQLDDSASPGIDVVLHLRHGEDVARDAWLRTRWHEGLSIRSVADLWPGAAWREREVHEMFGIGVEGFADAAGEELRPLLLPVGFDGAPLRKSFALAERAGRAWPGTKDPDERARNRHRAPGVPQPGEEQA